MDSICASTRQDWQAQLMALVLRLDELGLYHWDRTGISKFAQQFSQFSVAPCIVLHRRLARCRVDCSEM